MAEVATERLRLRTGELGWPLDELWVAGALLESADDLDHGSVVVMIDLPTGDLPWLAIHPTAEWIGEQLRLGKRPLSWTYRPTAWPAWTYRDRRVARFWSATDGLDQNAIETLRTGRTPEVIEPDRDELIGQLGVELGVAKTHLRSILDDYWDHAWRRALCPGDGHPLTGAQPNQVDLELSERGEDIEEHLPHRVIRVVGMAAQRQRYAALRQGVADVSGIGDGSCKSIQLGHHERVTSTYSCESLTEPRPLTLGAANAMVDVDPIRGNAER